jgi:hypothetical protein
MPDQPFTQPQADPWWWYHLKHLGTRIGAALGTAYYVWSTAPPKTDDDWVLFWLVMGLTVMGISFSAQGAKRVAQ